MTRFVEDQIMEDSPRQCTSPFCFGITLLEHSPYSPDLAPCDILFPKVKPALKGTRCESLESVNAKATEVLNQLTS
ncbi:hypothetical protein NQ318_020826 [Aromia moschata]|uniref:Uncharacterized protein n=1 Tax=Aromia moschata TaxID=1265417 RepID=A0AAV8Y8K8_9CUCU|nr:hypothetical protein NQ318_020826 [Aromia moschata]